MHFVEWNVWNSLTISLKFELTIFHHWFRWWLCADQATSHHLNQWMVSLLTLICIIRLQWVNWDLSSIQVKWMSIKSKTGPWFYFTLQLHHNGRSGVSNDQPHDCLLNRLFRRRSKKTSNLCFTGLCEGDSPVTGEFPTLMASNAENISIWLRHHHIRPCRRNSKSMEISFFSHLDFNNAIATIIWTLPGWNQVVSKQR